MSSDLSSLDMSLVPDPDADIMNIYIKHINNIIMFILLNRTRLKANWLNWTLTKHADRTMCLTGFCRDFSVWL